MSSEVDIVDQAAIFRDQMITTLVDAKFDRILAEARYDLAMGKLTQEEWAAMTGDERAHYTRRS